MGQDRPTIDVVDSSGVDVSARPSALLSVDESRGSHDDRYGCARRPGPVYQSRLMAAARGSGLRRLRRQLVACLVAYFVLGSISQKLLPGVDEIMPFFGWSLFTRVPNVDERYEVYIEQHAGRELEPAIPYLRASPQLAPGNPHLGRKLIQRLGRAAQDGNPGEIESLRRLFEDTYLAHPVRYRVVRERYEPLEKWQRGKALEEQLLATYSTGDGGLGS